MCLLNPEALVPLAVLLAVVSDSFSNCDSLADATILDEPGNLLQGIKDLLSKRVRLLAVRAPSSLD